MRLPYFLLALFIAHIIYKICSTSRKTQTKMGRPPKRRSTINGSSTQSGVKAKGEKWTQSEMETLASLCVKHGHSGILSKETNKATIAKKDSQWITGAPCSIRYARSMNASAVTTMC